MPSITNLVTTATFNVKINKVKIKIPNSSNLATTTDFIAVENKIPNVRNLVENTDYNTKIREI